MITPEINETAHTGAVLETGSAVSRTSTKYCNVEDAMDLNGQIISENEVVSANVKHNNGSSKNFTTATTVTAAEKLPQHNSSGFEKLKEFALNVEDLYEEVEYLIENFLIKQSLTMLFARAGEGKSYFVLCLCVFLLTIAKVKKVIYMDFDNSTASLKSRKLDGIIRKFGENFLYIHRKKVDNQSKLLDELVSGVYGSDFSDCIIVIDSIRDFLGGKDMNLDKDIIPLMDKLKALREMGATVIFLHHATKNTEKLTAKGSTSFNDSVDCAFALNLVNKFTNSLKVALTVVKDRLPVENKAFEIDTSTNTLVVTDYAVATMSNEDMEFIENVQKVLELSSDGINQNALLAQLGYRKDDKSAIKKLNAFNGRFYSVECGRQTKVYKPITTVVEN